MFNRKFSSNIHRKKRMIILSIILLVVFLSTGYAVFTTNLSIGGILNVSKYDQTLYGVLEKAAKKGTYAREYTGEHQDSMAGVGTEKIYHWYATSDENGTAIQNMNNVIFANHCWKMIRTTDTGGVKMIYNGEPENNQCLNTRGNHVGYDSFTTTTLSPNYYYGTRYVYDKESNVFKLSGAITTGEIGVGQYTCKSTSSTGTCKTLYLVESLDSDSLYFVFTLKNNSHYSQYGISTFNYKFYAPSYVGYMYNTVYNYKQKQVPSSTMYTQTSMDNYSNYYYGTGISYSGGNYTLTGTTQATWINTYSSSHGLYTCKSTTDTTCSTVYYIVAGIGGNMYGITMTGGHLLDYYNTDIVLGTGYNESNGQYSLTNTTTIKKLDWYNNYSTYNHYYICGNYGASCGNSNLTYITSPYSYYYFGVTTSENYLYGNSFTYNSSTNKYTLSGDTKNLWFMDSADRQTLNTHHYTCFNDSGECSTLLYIYSAKSPTSYDYMYYISLNNGKSINDALNDMLANDNVNQYDSTMKRAIDLWYESFLDAYTIDLEETIFCNNRDIKSLGGWNPNGGSVTSNLIFEDYDANNDLSCTTETDRFSILNNKALLNYSVGLATASEMNLLNNSNVRKTYKYYRLASASEYDGTDVFGSSIDTNGLYGHSNIYSSYGVRPVISLKKNMIHASGTGSMANPYVVHSTNQQMN